MNEAVAPRASDGESPILDDLIARCREAAGAAEALAEAARGAAPDTIAARAADAGYDVTPVRPLIDMLAARREG